MGEATAISHQETSSPLSSLMLQALRHPRLIPRSISPSFALQSQLIGTEFCASLSAAMVQTAQKFHSTPPLLQEKPATIALLHDLSAHYGSHTMRRAASYPLGPCYSSRQRRVSKGHHDGRRQLWSLRTAHRWWCRYCGVYLVVGETKELLPRSFSGLSHIIDEDKGANLVDIKPLEEKKMVGRGTYVCRRCLEKEWTLWKKNGCMGIPPQPASSSSFSSCLDPSSVTLNEKSFNTVTDSSGRNYTGETTRIAASVGRTRRRKRNRRGGGLMSVVEGVGAGNTLALQKAAVCAVPKGSFSRGKRSRAVVHKETAVVPDERGRHPTTAVNIQRSLSDSVHVRKASRVENCTITQPNSSGVVETETNAEAVGTVYGVSAGLRKLPSKGRRSSPKKTISTSSTKSANSFTDTLSKLGL